MLDRRLGLLLVGLAVIVGSAGSARADATVAPDASDALQDSTSTGALKVLTALILTVAAILLVAMLVKRVPMPGGATPDLTLENRLAVSRAGQVAVLRVDGRRILVGITASQVNLIAELDGKDAPAHPDRNAFERLVSGMLGRREKA